MTGITEKQDSRFESVVGIHKLLELFYSDRDAYWDRLESMNDAQLRDLYYYSVQVLCDSGLDGRGIMQTHQNVDWLITARAEGEIQ